MTTPKISLGIPPGPLTLEAAELADELGYHRLWLYDSAAIWEDIWVHMGMVAERTQRIGLGTAVLVPNLRHVMTTASAIATIERVAPGRLVCGFGTGFTARHVLGQRPLTWATTERYLRQLKALLAGEVVEVDGERCQMIHHPEMGVERPIVSEIIVSAFGPKGQAVARELSDGLMTIGRSVPDWEQCIRMVHGTVLDEAESSHSERAIDAAGPWWVVTYHGLWESRGPEAVLQFPGGAEYLDRVAADRPAGERHLAIHEGHCTHLTERDRLLVDAAGSDLAWSGWVGEPADIRARVDAAGEAGATELIYNPAGPDPLREIRAFAEATLG
jgi:5,10-methylenetetrahydromethanopterin reductase